MTVTINVSKDVGFLILSDIVNSKVLFLFSYETTVTMNVTKDIGIYYLGKRIKTEIIETQVKVTLKWQSMAGLFFIMLKDFFLLVSKVYQLRTLQKYFVVLCAGSAHLRGPHNGDRDHTHAHVVHVHCDPVRHPHAHANSQVPMWSTYTVTVTPFATFTPTPTLRYFRSHPCPRGPRTL